MKSPAIILCLTLACCGCRAITSVPMVLSPTATTSSIFNGVSHLEFDVRANGTREDATYTISSASEISQIETAFARAKWRPFIDTIPADSVRFRAMNGNIELFAFTYGGGWIFKWSANPHDKGIPTDADSQILRQIIDGAQTQNQTNAG